MADDNDTDDGMDFEEDPDALIGVKLRDGEIKAVTRSVVGIRGDCSSMLVYFSDGTHIEIMMNEAASRTITDALVLSLQLIRSTHTSKAN